MMELLIMFHILTKLVWDMWEINNFLLLGVLTVAPLKSEALSLTAYLSISFLINN